MDVVLLQRDIIWADPKSNRAGIDKAFERNGRADLFVLPEMFSTGFATEPEGIAENEPCETLEWMKERAASLDAAIAGSVLVLSGGKYYNRMYFVKPDGEVTVYDKKHLFTYGSEPDHITAGDRRVVVEWRGARFLLLVCYDLRFPVWVRNRGDYDAIICVANWPTVRRNAWDCLKRARAIENQCYMLAVNRVGVDPTVEYNGGTAFINFYGEVEAAAEDGVECSIRGGIDMSKLGEFASKFPVLKDADRFEIK